MAKVIQLKFDFGDKVYHIAYKPYANDLSQICPVCNGTGRFVSPVSGNEKECPGVTGYMCVDGRMAVSYKNYAIPLSGNITDIILEPNEEYYEVDNYETIRKDKVYATLEEAKVVCDAHNSNIKFCVKKG